MSSPVAYEVQADFEVEGFGLLDASTLVRPDAVSLDYLTCWALGPVVVGDTTFGPELRIWQARVVQQGTVLLMRSTIGRDAWDIESEREILVYDATFPILEMTLGFTAQGEWVIVAERPTGPEGASDLWIASSNPFYHEAIPPEES